MRLFITLVIILFCYNISFSQFSIGISLSGIGYHPNKEKYKNTDLYRWKLDKKGQFVAFSSMTLFLSYKFNDYLGAKLMQSIVIHDCAGHFAGITHIGVNFYDDIIGFINPNHQLSVTFGPFWYYRKNWNSEENYRSDTDYLTVSQNRLWESKFVWHGGQIEYSYLPDKSNIAYTINFLPAIPYLYTLGVGAKFLP